MKKNTTQWIKVLGVLKGDLPDSTPLSPEENLLLSELKDIEEGCSMYQGDMFDSYAQIGKVKQRLDFSDSRPFVVNYWFRIAIVAASIAIFAFIIYLIGDFNNIKEVNNTFYVNDSVPRKSGVTLVLADGRKINLNDIDEGVLVGESGFFIRKTADGRIEYVVDKASNSTNQSNVLSTAKGESTVVDLPDGTRVWLNAASSLTYNVFLKTQNERRIKLSGEAYFEVAKQKNKKFIVEMPYGRSVEVLGTHFNINAYPDENKQYTTLLEGSVRLYNNDQKSILLQPGQRAAFDRATGPIDITTVDTAVVMAWKNNKFNFDGLQFPEIMNQLERWYDIQVIYKGKVPKIKFYGELDRSNSLQYILKALKESGVDLELQGNLLLVSP